MYWSGKLSWTNRNSFVKFINHFIKIENQLYLSRLKQAENLFVYEIFKCINVHYNILYNR